MWLWEYSTELQELNEAPMKKAMAVERAMHSNIIIDHRFWAGINDATVECFAIILYCAEKTKSSIQLMQRVAEKAWTVGR